MKEDKETTKSPELRRKHGDAVEKHGSQQDAESPVTSSGRRKDRNATEKDGQVEEARKGNNLDEQHKAREGKGDSGSPSPIPVSGGGSDSRPSGSSGSGEDGGRRGRRGERALQKPSVPDVYPQVMAIPIAKRPLFPGFYKAITIRDPNVAAAIQEMMKRGQPYVGAFLFKDEDADGDVIESLD